jgi:hypothetical protein
MITICCAGIPCAAMGYWMVKRDIYGLAGYFRRLGINDIENAAQFFAWLLCWHDIGKFSRSFQQLYSHDNLCVQKDSRKHMKKYPCVAGILAMEFPLQRLSRIISELIFPFVNLSV